MVKEPAGEWKRGTPATIDLMTSWKYLTALACVAIVLLALFVVFGHRGHRLEDAWITAKIDGQYVADRHLSSRRIRVTTERGLVTLNGEVPNEQARQAAVRIASDTSGVTGVINQLEIAPAR